MRGCKLNFPHLGVGHIVHTRFLVLTPFVRLCPLPMILSLSLSLYITQYPNHFLVHKHKGTFPLFFIQNHQSSSHVLLMLFKTTFL
ncbi:hypothetical protein RIF29_11789 [Crotalaria pallida]|uniref:Uncharacterized protein n=1 Tax=Crotalaria pallida TaxID=3830 RepID=A0AAN9IMG6_CROPI